MKKHLLPIIFCLLLPFLNELAAQYVPDGITLTSQAVPQQSLELPAYENWCHTPPVSQAALRRVLDQVHAHRSANTTWYIPVTFHLIGDNDGNGYTAIYNVVESMCTLNNNFAPYNFFFYIEGDINYINNDTLFDFPANFIESQELDNLIIQHNVLNTLNIYVNFKTSPSGGPSFAHWSQSDTLDVGSPPISFFPQQHAIIIRKFHLQAFKQLLTHEVGHFFGLWHTFLGWDYCGLSNEDYAGVPAPEVLTTDYEWNDIIYNLEFQVEKADGSNCSVAGDLLCDTPADYASLGFECDSNGQSPFTMLDPDSIEFQADGLNHMTYGDNHCRTSFSPEQVQIMQFYVDSVRSYLLYDQSPPPELPSLEVTAIFPPENETIPVTFPIELQWEITDGLYYYIQYGRVLDGNNFEEHYDSGTPITQNSISMGVEPYQDYYWIVGATTTNYHYYPCPSYVDTFYFSTSEAVAVSQINSLPQVQIFPNPAEESAFVSGLPKGAWSVRIFTPAGSIVRPSAPLVNNELNISELATGLYFLELNNGQQTIIRRLVKQ